MANPIYPATTNQQAIALTIFNAEQFHQIINGSITTSVQTYEGHGNIPSVAKALHDAAAYKEPIAWVSGDIETELMQPRLYNNNVYVPLQVPAVMGATPDSNVWRLYLPKNKVVIYRESQTGADIVANVSTLTTLSYGVGENDLRVYVDGARVSEGRDYEETSPTSITWLIDIDEEAFIQFECGDTAAGQVDTATFIQLKDEAEQAAQEAKDAAASVGGRKLNIKAVTTPYVLLDSDLIDNSPTLLLFDDGNACEIQVGDGLTVGGGVSFRNKQGAPISIVAVGSSTVSGAGTTTNDSTKVNSLYIEDEFTIVTVGDMT